MKELTTEPTELSSIAELMTDTKEKKNTNKKEKLMRL